MKTGQFILPNGQVIDVDESVRTHRSVMPEMGYYKPRSGAGQARPKAKKVAKHPAKIANAQRQAKAGNAHLDKIGIERNWSPSAAPYRGSRWER